MSIHNSQEEAHRKILIAIDGSMPASHAVGYAATIFKLIPDLHIVLLYVLPSIPPYLKEESRTDGSALSKLKKLKEINLAGGEKILEKGKNQLIAAQFSPGRIETKMLPRITGLAKDIANEAEHGLYDALLVGRRGLSGAQELFMGSVSNQLVQYAANTPLWVIDRLITDPKVMMAVDGSESSLKAVDHVAYMFGNNPQAEVHFLHVVPKLQDVCPIDLDNTGESLKGMESEIEMLDAELLQGSQACMDDFTPRATQILREAGFSSDRITVEVREVVLGVAVTILKAAQEGGYGTIVLGRRGMGRSHFLGSVSDRVIRRATGQAIWVVN
ncbi:MAG: universal stress protein [Deltaproteobacteria bacterium]|nr:universal stress protein [Deltaproteobacteria bacterium]MBW2053491.1 universal stress protein [Deltaproteobacteria bacterium]MBW2140868.1 universal stress protein [Deltaproteobacteria bacterium]MBW2323106.1 universal stress protein [Deltaproteobacteria bacterium]